MALHFHSAPRKDYPFLAHPPPQKRRPLQPLPSPPSSRPSLDPTQATRGPHHTAIASWAAHVQPGSPASLSPRSPYRRPSLRRGRCPSVASTRVPSVSFLHTAPTPTVALTPTPSIRDFKADLTTVGYTSVFLQLPNTPVSATLTFSIKPQSPSAAKNICFPPVPSPTCKPRGFTRFRSLSVLRSRGRSKSACPDSPTRMKAKAAVASAAIVERKKAKYVMRPPPMANELALMQFVDGGSVDDNIKRIMEVQAKASGVVGLADIYRDGEGRIWWDQDEKWEYTHLLAEGDGPHPHATGDLQWVTFRSNSPSTANVSEEDRRDSVSTQDSDLDPKYVVRAADSLDGDDLKLFGGVVAPLTTPKPPVSVLSLSPPPRRTAQHLRKPDFITDAAFSRLHASPKSPRHSTSSGMRSKGKARRRPAPLKLCPPSPALKRPTNFPIDADKARKDFIDSSFKPMNLAPVTPVTPATTPVEARSRFAGNSRGVNVPWRTVNDGLMSLAMKKKPSVLNMMGFFRSARKEDVMA